MRAEATAPRMTPETLGSPAGKSLYVPSLQPEPIPVRRVAPAPCTQACPAGVEVKAYVSLIAEERFAEAHEVVRRRCPLPGICGRICTAPCELACIRDEVDDPIAIKALKRFAADVAREAPAPPLPQLPADRPERVAVIGSGPAGLTAAYDLRRAGFPVTVFEAESEPGGMLRYGIAAYRLPRDIIDEEIEFLARTGMEIRTGVRLGSDLDLEELSKNGYTAVVLAVGAQLGRRLGVPGEEDRREVSDALAFLRRVNAGERPKVGKRTLVIGGGSTAIEAARAARRLGAESVQIIYRRSPQEVLASNEEVEAAKAEGVQFRFLTAPSKILTSSRGRFKGLECRQVALGEPDSSGRRRPIVIPGTEFPIEGNQILAAVGQAVDLEFLPSQIRNRLLEEGKLAVDRDTLKTRLTRVYAAGDMVTGPSTVIEAIAAGHRVAESIRRSLDKGQPAVAEAKPEASRALEEYELPDPIPMKAARYHPAMRAILTGREFEEVEQAFTRAEAVAEARRCMRCGNCSECSICATTCQRRHVTIQATNGSAPGPRAILRAPANLALSLDAVHPAPGWLLPGTPAGKRLDVQTEPEHAVEVLPLRAEIDREHCRGCSACVEVCPFHAVSSVAQDGTQPHARIEPALCRGCNLCTAVCPTRAASARVLSPEWWGGHVEDAATAALARGPHVQSRVILACANRVVPLETVRDDPRSHVEIIRLRCVGQAEVGMLLDLVKKPNSRVLVAGCATARCRFGTGAVLAQEQVRRARAMLTFLGRDPDRITTDWSKGPPTDHLEPPMARFVQTPEPMIAPAPAPAPKGGDR